MSKASELLSKCNESTITADSIPAIPNDQKGWSDENRKVGYYVMVTDVKFKGNVTREVVEGPFKTKTYASDFGKKYYPGKLEIDFGYEDEDSNKFIQQGGV